jgi:VanZ family protein
MGKRVRYYILSAYIIFVSTLFFLPGSAFPKNNWLTQLHFDKWVHIGIFFILGMLIFWSFNLRKTSSFIIIFFILATYGIIVEIIQDQYVINRSFDIWDWVADMGGFLLALIVWGVYKKNRPL